MIIDSHCHLYDEKLRDILPDILKNLNETGQYCVCSGACLETSKECVQLANDNKTIFATVGDHPEYIQKYSDSDLVEYEKMCKNKKVVAIGEIGLDYYYDESSKEKQKEILKKQILLAEKLQKPCVFHVREAMGDFLEIIKEMREHFKYSSLVHSFSGSVEVAKILLDYGFYLSFNGISTFKNANKVLDVIKAVPLDRILIETDSPYLTPVPFRGKLNEPKYVKYVAQKIAELKNVSEEEVIFQTFDNAKRLFKFN